MYPNPATHTIYLDYELPESTSGSLLIYDAFGKVVKSIPTIDLEAGLQTLNIEVADLSAGMYFCTIQTSDWQAVQKFIIMK